MEQSNHICRNKNCKNGVDGQPKHYYACNDCDKYNSWRAVACSPECYQEYVDAIIASRSKPTEKVVEESFVVVDAIVGRILGNEALIIEPIEEIATSGYIQVDDGSEPIEPETVSILSAYEKQHKNKFKGKYKK